MDKFRRGQFRRGQLASSKRDSESKDAMIKRLSLELVAAKAEAVKWKASHDNQVALKRMLMDRPDLKDRAASMQLMQAEIGALKAEVAVLTQVIASGPTSNY